MHARGRCTPGERVSLGGINARKLGLGIFLGLVSYIVHYFHAMPFFFGMGAFITTPGTYYSFAPTYVL